MAKRARQAVGETGLVVASKRARVAGQRQVNAVRTIIA